MVMWIGYLVLNGEEAVPIAADEARDKCCSLAIPRALKMAATDINAANFLEVDFQERDLSSEEAALLNSVVLETLGDEA